METCVLCGQEFEPLPLPEISELFGVKSPHRKICPPCIVKHGLDVMKFVVTFMDVYQKEKERKKKEESN